MTSILMVKLGYATGDVKNTGSKFKTYKADGAGRAIAAADARDYGTEVEEYRIYPDGTFVRVGRDK